MKHQGLLGLVRTIMKIYRCIYTYVKIYRDTRVPCFRCVKYTLLIFRVARVLLLSFWTLKGCNCKGASRALLRVVIHNTRKQLNHLDAQYSTR